MILRLKNLIPISANYNLEHLGQFHILTIPLFWFYKTGYRIFEVGGSTKFTGNVGEDGLKAKIETILSH